jgi:hypothetical protein
MTLSRLVNYVDGNTLTGQQLNNEFDNILNNGPSLVNLTLPALSAVQGLTGSIILNIGSFAAQGYQLISTSASPPFRPPPLTRLTPERLGPSRTGAIRRRPSRARTFISTRSRQAAPAL